MTDEPRVIALGETMLSLVSAGPLGRATTLLVTHGGAESNACVGLARLGVSAAWVGRLGTDAAGDRVTAALAGEGLVLDHLARDRERPTGVMLRDTVGTIRYDRAGSAASAATADDLAGVRVERAEAVLVTGITALLGDGPAAAAVALLERGRGLRVVDPHVRPGLPGSARAAELVRPLVERADLLLGGATELAAIVGAAEPRTLAERCLALGPREVVVKLGREGAGAADRGGAWHEHPGEPVEDVDPVGAGDAFDAGYLAIRLGGGSIPDALRVGAACGAAVASTLGDTEGFPRSIA